MNILKCTVTGKTLDLDYLSFYLLNTEQEKQKVFLDDVNYDNNIYSNPDKADEVSYLTDDVETFDWWENILIALDETYSLCVKIREMSNEKDFEKFLQELRDDYPSSLDSTFVFSDILNKARKEHLRLFKTKYHMN